MAEIGFFSSPDVLTGRPQPILVPRCGLCGLFKRCRSPKMKPYGEGRRGILIVGEAPGADEDEEGRPFVGKSGQLLRRTLAKSGVDMDRDCWVTNSAICRPKGNVYPPKVVEWCRPNLLNALEELRPSTVILLGEKAVKSLIGWLWRDDVGTMGRWAGWRIPSQRLNAWVCPTWHPSYVQRTEGSDEGEVASMLFARHLEAACGLEGRPWKEVPDWAGRVRIELDPEKAADLLALFQVDLGPVAVDLETNMLKPDGKDAAIHSCAVSDGTTTIAYPWHGRAVGEMKKVLESAVPKIGFNIKFETRWAARFGIRVRNWLHDGMLAAHVLDNRSGITSLTFQAFVRLGHSDHKDDTQPYLEAGGSNLPNRIRDCPLEKLLLRNGLDALLEWKIGMKQMEEMGIAPGGR